MYQLELCVNAYKHKLHFIANIRRTNKLYFGHFQLTFSASTFFPNG